MVRGIYVDMKCSHTNNIRVGTDRILFDEGPRVRYAKKGKHTELNNAMSLCCPFAARETVRDLFRSQG